MTKCMNCQRRAPAWNLGFVQDRTAVGGDSQRRMALMLCDRCYQDKGMAFSEHQDSGGWRLQRVSPVAAPGAPRRQLALAAVAAGSPQVSGTLRSWWSGLFGR